MSVSQISPTSLTTTNPYVNPTAKTTETQSGAIQEGNRDAQKPVKAAQTDTVTISQQALQKVADSNNSKSDTTQSSTNAQKQQQSFSIQV